MSKGLGRRFSHLPIIFAWLLWGSLAIAHPDLILQIEALDGQLAADPGNAELLCRRGDLHRRHEDYESAARDFESARGVDPNYPLIDFLEAKLMLDTGEPGPAEKMLSRYLSLNPGHGSAWVLRGRAFIMLGKPDEAAKDFTSAIAISQRPSPEVYRLQILSLAARGSDHSVETLSAVNIGLERFPYEVSLLGLGVDIALSENQVEIARGYLEGLPEKLYSLPQWEIRAAAVECLAAEESIERSKCLGEAKLRLEHQIQQFMGQEDG